MENDIFSYLSLLLPKISAAAPFYEIDAFVLSVFAYVPMGKDIRNYTGHMNIDPIGKTIGYVCSQLLNPRNQDILAASFKKDDHRQYSDFINYCALIRGNERYRDLIITNHKFNNEGFCQFAAYTVKIENAFVICYRGTDGTYEGWYEDFRLLDEDIPAQKEAVDYIDLEMAKNGNSGFYLVGHSKGGNLGIYAALCCKNKNKKHIQAVYNFDGPGFNKKFLTQHIVSIMKMYKCIYAYYIQNTIVGELLFGQKLLTMKKNRHYVEASSKVSFPLQHSFFAWIIKDKKFIECKQSFISILINTNIDAIIDSTDSKDLNTAISNVLKFLHRVRNEYSRLPENIADSLISSKAY